MIDLNHDWDGRWEMDDACLPDVLFHRLVFFGVVLLVYMIDLMIPAWTLPYPMILFEPT